MKVIVGKYGLDSNCWLPYVRGSGPTSKIWADICSLENSSSPLGYSIRDIFRVQVNLGNATIFWEHSWLGETCLKDEYPRLFSLSTQQEVKACLLWGNSNGGCWELLFRRRPFGREKYEMENLKQRLQGVTLNPTKLDLLQWRWAVDRNFSVKSAYDHWEVFSHSNNGLFGSSVEEP